MRELIQSRIVATISQHSQLDDAADIGDIKGDLLITTDSYVVSPLFFPGGDIGSLSVYGTVNDLSVSGGIPICLTVSLILEEGLPMETLDRVLKSIALASRRCGVEVAAGDTKVVPRGAADQLFINTSGLGSKREPAPAGAASIRVASSSSASKPETSVQGTEIF